MSSTSASERRRPKKGKIERVRSFWNLPPSSSRKRQSSRRAQPEAWTSHSHTSRNPQLLKVPQLIPARAQIRKPFPYLKVCCLILKNDGINKQRANGEMKAKLVSRFQLKKKSHSFITETDTSQSLRLIIQEFEGLGVFFLFFLFSILFDRHKSCLEDDFVFLNQWNITMSSLLMNQDIALKNT